MQKVDELFFDLTARTGPLVANVGRAQTRMRRFSSFMKGSGGPIVVLTLFAAAAAAAGLAATRMASVLDKALREVSTLLPQTVTQLTGLRRSIIDLSTQVPEPPTQLTRALYQAVSAGARDTAEALNLVEVASKAAVAGLSDSFTAVDAITTVLNAYQLEISEATRVSDVFFKTIEQGKLRFEDIAANIGNVATSAALSGVSIEELGAALATMTKFGISAAEASTALNRFLLSVTQSTDDQKEAARKLGIEWNLTTLRSRGLIGFLGDLEEATQGNLELLAEINPNIRASRAAFILAGEGAAEYARILDTTRNASGSTQSAFEKMNGSLDNQATLLKNRVNARLLELGAVVLPTVIRAIEELNRLLETETEAEIRILEKLGRVEEANAARRKQLIDNQIRGIKDVRSEIARLEDDIRKRVQQAFGTVQRGQFGEGVGLRPTGAVLTRPLDDLQLEAELENAIRIAEELERSGRLRGAELQGVREVLALREEQLRLVRGIAEEEINILGSLTGQQDLELAALERRLEILSAGGAGLTEEADAIRVQRDLRANQLQLEKERARLTTLTASVEVRSIEDANRIRNELVREAADLEGEQKRNLLAQADTITVIIDQFRTVEALEKARNAIGREAIKLVEDQSEELADLVDLMAELRDLGVDFNDTLGDPTLEKARQLLEAGSGATERNIESLRQSLERVLEIVQAAKEFERSDFLLGDKQASALRARNLLEAQRALEAIADSEEEVGVKALKAQGVLQRFGVTIDDLAPGFRRFVKSLADANEGLDDLDETILDTIRDISFGVRALVDLGSALGFVDGEAASVVNSLSLVAEGVARLQAGDLSGIGGIIGGVGGVVGSLFGESPEERARKELLERNTAALRALSDRLEDQRTFIGGLTGGQIGGLRGAVGGLLEDLPPLPPAILDRFLSDRLAEALGAVGLTMTDLEQVARALGVEIPEGTRGMREFLTAVTDFLDDINLEEIFGTFTGQLELLRLELELFDVDDPVERLRRFVDLFTEFTKLPKELQKELEDLDLSTPEGRARLEEITRQLFADLAPLFEAGAFGELTFDQVLEFLRSIDSSLDGFGDDLEVDVVDGTGGFQSFNQITRLQAERLEALGVTRNFLIEQQLLVSEAMLALFEDAVTDPLSPLAPFIDPKLPGDTIITVGDIQVVVPPGTEDPEAIAAAVADTTVDRIDRALGGNLLKERATIGTLPVITR